jgi:homopolymeric O-antigen transport system permease protein
MTVALRRPRHAGDLIRELVARDVKLRYRRSVLGIAWSQLAPLSMIAVLSFIFGHVIKLSIPHYPAFLFSGMLAWIWFQSSLIAGTQSVVSGRDLIRQPGFPTPLLPVIAIGTNLVNYLLAVPVMLLFIGFTTHHVPATVVALPAIIAVQFLVTLGPVYVLAAINVMFRDVGHIVEIALFPIFYASAIFYIPPAKSFHLLFTLNPIAHLMSAYRAVLWQGRWPDAMPLLVLAIIGCAVVAVGYAIFDHFTYRFPAEL